MVKRAWMATGLVALAAAPLLAQAAAPNARQDRVTAAFNAVDADRDGYLTRAEADGARERLRQRMEAAAKERRDRSFARLDQDRNGSISRAEFDSAPRMAMMAMPRMRARAGMAAGLPLFERMDADRDGRVSLAEAQAVVNRRYAMRGAGRGMGALPPGHPPVANPRTPTPLEDGPRPLGGGRN